MKKMTRLDFLKKNIDYSELIRHYEYRDCDEFIVDRYGDICVFRVYGNSENNYKISEH